MRNWVLVYMRHVGCPILIGYAREGFDVVELSESIAREVAVRGPLLEAYTPLLVGATLAELPYPMFIASNPALRYFKSYDDIVAAEGVEFKEL